MYLLVGAADGRLRGESGDARFHASGFGAAGDSIAQFSLLHVVNR